MNIGISTSCFYPLEVESALTELGKAGIKNTEVFMNSDCEISIGFVEKLNQTRKKLGINVHSLHPFTSGYEHYLLFSEYTRRTRDSMNYYARYARAASLLGAKYLVIHGDRAPGVISESEYFERFAELTSICNFYGITPIQENVNKFRSADPEFIANMRAAIPDVKFVFDIKQCLRSGVEPTRMLEAMGENVAHIHLSDNTASESCLLPGKGDYDFDKLFQHLQKIGYSGSCLVEVYRSAFKDTVELCDSLKYIQNTTSCVFDTI